MSRSPSHQEIFSLTVGENAFYYRRGLEGRFNLETRSLSPSLFFYLSVAYGVIMAALRPTSRRFVRLGLPNSVARAGSLNEVNYDCIIRGQRSIPFSREYPLDNADYRTNCFPMRCNVLIVMVGTYTPPRVYSWNIEIAKLTSMILSCTRIIFV